MNRSPARSSTPLAPPRIAMACPGVGLEQRGFERYFRDLFHLVEDEVAITLFKGGGPNTEREKVLLFARRNGLLPKLFPVHALFGRSPIHSECMTFALALLPHLISGRFDVVHCIDPPLTRLLFHLRRVLGMRFALLYTEGCAMPPADYPPSDHMQQISRITYGQALEFGIPEERMTLLPCGVACDRFLVEEGRDQQQDLDVWAIR